MRVTRSAAIGALVVIGAAAAPVLGEPRRLELGGFTGVAYFGDDIELGNSWAAEQKPGTAAVLGLRVGVVALPDATGRHAAFPHLDLGVELEARVALASTGGSFDGGRGSYFAPVIGWRGHAIARLERLTRHLSPHVVVGGGGETVTSASPFLADETDALFYWGLGATWAVSSRWAVRLDGRHGLTAGRTHDVTSTIEVQLGAMARWGLGARAAPRPPRDGDGDGVPDRDDACPTEPETANGVDDTDGCPDDPDQDGDGIHDSHDGCPFDAEDANGIDDDDGCPDPDGDADGVVGSRDACPDRAEDRDGYQDDDGCPELDNDGDGLDDMHDTCPVEAEVWNGFADDDGCPDELPAKLRAFEGVMQGINFQKNKAKILPSSRKTLARTVAVLREFPALRVRITGYTDDTGPRDRNVDLSRRRAEAVKWYLVDQGIAEDRVETEGLGPDQPIAANTTAGGRAKNRRIEFHIVVAAPPAPPAPAAPSPAPPAAPAPAP